MKTVEQALEHLLNQAKNSEKTETRQLGAALGCVLAEDIISPIQVPPADNSMMDGYAVNSEDLQPNFVMQVSQRIPAGSAPDALEPGTVARIFTGAPIPAGADVVIMQEEAEPQGDGVVFSNFVEAGENIRRAGEDIAQGSVILERGQKLRAQDLALIASVGIAEIKVYSPLKLVTFTTGDELVEPGNPLAPGKIYNSNHTNISLLVQRLGFEWIDLGQVADTLEATKQALTEAAKLGDIIITTGGVSVGEEDHLKPAVESLGSLDMWQVKMKPGKPLAFGFVADKPFLGLPGNPVSAFATFNLFARPFLLKTQGAKDFSTRTTWLQANFNWDKPGFRREYLRGQLENSGQQTLVNIYPHQGSGVLSSTVWADGLVVIPEDTVIKAGDKVEFINFNDL